jgi:hypothetical protein
MFRVRLHEPLVEGYDVERWQRTREIRLAHPNGYYHDLRFIGGLLMAVDANHSTVEFFTAPTFAPCGILKVVQGNAIDPVHLTSAIVLNKTLLYTIFAPADATEGWRQEKPDSGLVILQTGTQHVVCAAGLTRPHTLQATPDGRIAVCNSGASEVWMLGQMEMETVKLNGGFTRGLAFDSAGGMWVGCSTPRTDTELAPCTLVHMTAEGDIDFEQRLERAREIYDIVEV